MSETAGSLIAPKRRSFLNLMLGVGVVGWAGTILYPVLRYLRPLSTTETGPLTLKPDEVTKVERDHFVIVRSGTRKAIVFDVNGQIRALDAKCTHEGCTVQYVAADELILCACHNGKYDINGRVLSGPPPRPLATWAVSKEDDTVRIDRETGAAAGVAAA